MWRLSIRELILLTLVVALGIGWFLEHQKKAPPATVNLDRTAYRLFHGQVLIVRRSAEGIEVETEWRRTD